MFKSVLLCVYFKSRLQSEKQKGKHNEALFYSVNCQRRHTFRPLCVGPSFSQTLIEKLGGIILWRLQQLRCCLQPLALHI